MLWYALACLGLAVALWSDRHTLKPLSYKVVWQPKIRTWCVMVGCSLATFIYQSSLYYLGLCLLSAAVVLSYPMTQFQRLIGWIFIAMAGLNIGYIFAINGNVQNFLSAARAANALHESQIQLGWIMLATYLLWGAYDIFRGYRIFSNLPHNHDADFVEPAQ